MIPIYPTSSTDSFNSTLNVNTGFEDPTAGYPANTVYLNTGVNFLNYFNIVYDPVSGFISYIANGTSSSNGQYGPSVTPVLALQGGTAQAPIVIPDGTMWNTPVFLFTAIGSDGPTTGSGPTTSCYSSNSASDVRGCTAVDVVLSTPGTVMFNQPISSDTIVNCTSNCSTGLVLSGGTFFLNAQNTYTGATTVYPGATLIVNGSIASSTGSTSTTCPDMPTVALSGLTVCTGGAVGGIGTLPTTTIYGTLAPGFQIGTTAVIGTLTVQGNLTFGPTGTYQVVLAPTAGSSTTVTGTASLAGTVLAAFSPNSYVPNKYTILHTSGGLGGTTFNTLTTSNLPTNFAANLSYTPTDVVLNLTAALGAGLGLSQNQQNVAGAVNNFFNNGGALPPNFLPLFGLTGANLANALTLLSGEPATGAQQGAFQLMTQFLGVMLDPFVDGRSGVGGVYGYAIPFAPDCEPLPEDIALAYAKVLRTPVYKAPVFEQRWGVWGAGYGGANRTTGDLLVVGSHDLSAHTAGGAAGLDYRVAPGTIVGFALAGGGTGWSLAQGLGGGSSDAFQAGVYAKTHYGPFYLAGALAYTQHWMSTDRLAFAGDRLQARFNAESFGGRAEAGYRVPNALAAITPYTAIQAQNFHAPTYSETDITGGGFGLAYAAHNATDTRSELGARFDRPILFNWNAVLALRGKVAWAHDWISDPSLMPTFEALPGASFIVNGATPAKNSALTSAGAELRLINGISLLGKFDGEFATHSHTYAGTGTVRYVW
jgi:autotransporter-associated beta strand protein